MKPEEMLRKIEYTQQMLDKANDGPFAPGTGQIGALLIAVSNLADVVKAMVENQQETA